MKLINLKNILGINLLLLRRTFRVITAFAGITPKRLLTIILILLLPFRAEAIIIIRDSEIESIIKDAINPIAKVANIGNIGIILIQNEEINAFTGGGNEIFVHSGLISQFPDIEVFKGVMAHEMGHIIGHHNSRQMQNLANQSKIAMTSIAIGLAAGVASSDPTVMVAGTIAGMDMVEKSMLRYSRTYESSADQAAFKLLEKSGNSAIGLQKLLHHFQSENRGIGMNKYLMTHPLFNERLDAVAGFLQTSRYKNSTSAASLQKRFERASYKLLAFTTSQPKLILSKTSLIKNPELRLYVEAICHLRLTDFKHSIETIDRLIAINPNDPYYNELKGQILFEFGKKESIGYFEKAVNLVPNDSLMRMNAAIVAWNIYRNQPEKLSKYLNYIKIIQQKEPESITPYYYLSMYYGALKNETFSRLYLAIYYDKQDHPQAKTLARSAVAGLKPETPEWYWAKDIIEREVE
jgi:predicted Zn-dependent protease